MMEDKILNKRFNELTAEEKQFYIDLFENESEFEQIKLTMIQIKNMNKSDILQPNAKIKEELMASFQEKWGEKAVPWYKKWWLFFINPEKPILYKPAFQIALGIAIVVLLLQVIPFNTKPTYMAKNTDFSVQKESKLIRNREIKSSINSEKSIEKAMSENELAGTKDTQKPKALKNKIIANKIAYEAPKIRQKNTAMVPAVNDDLLLDKQMIAEGYTSDVAPVAASYSSNRSSLKEMESKKNGTNSSATIQFNHKETVLLNLLETAF